MTTTQYLEFDSTYRDRNQYPFPGSFVIEISQSGQKSKENALDPVSNASPILYWNNSFQETTAANVSAGITIDTSFAPTDPVIMKITSPTGGIRYSNDFYNGAIFQLDVSGTNTLRRIVDYEYLGLASSVENAILKLDTALPGGTWGTGYIQNPTPIPTDTSNAVIKFFIPGSEGITNFYTNYKIQSITGSTLSSVSRNITTFDATTHLATLVSSTPEDWSSNGNANNNFAIRKDVPVLTANIVGSNPNGSILQLSSNSSSENGYYVGSFIRSINPIPTNAGFSTKVAPYSQERRIARYTADNGTFVSIANGSASFTLSNNASNVDGYYVNCYITDNTASQTRFITSYTGATRSGTVSSNWAAGVANGDSWFVRTAFLTQSFTVPPTTGTPFELELYTKDNATPFSFNGTLVSSQQDICYEIELLNLILPNIALVCGRGGRAIFYPYLYVELQQIASALGTHRGVIYSNNPNAYKMMFRAVVDDTVQPVYSPFIKIDGDGMVHKLKFKPNDCFRFSVYTPSGDLFQTEPVDNVSPTEPNPLVQVSACFAVKRLT